MANYESDHTKFMREWLEKNPEQKEVRQEGRSLYWGTAPEPQLGSWTETKVSKKK